MSVYGFQPDLLVDCRSVTVAPSSWLRLMTTSTSGPSLTVWEKKAGNPGYAEFPAINGMNLNRYHPPVVGPDVRHGDGIRRELLSAQALGRDHLDRRAATQERRNKDDQKQGGWFQLKRYSLLTARTTGV